MARLVGLLELSRPDLVEPYRRHEEGVLVEELVHLFVDPLGLYRHVIEVHLPKEGRAQLVHPLDPRLGLSLGGDVAGGLQHRLQGQLGVGGHSEIGREDPPQLTRVYIYVHELSVAAIHVQVAGMPLGPAVADANDEVALEEERICIALAGLDAYYTHVEGMVFWDHALPHVGRADRDLQVLGQLHEFLGSLGDDNPATRHKDRALGLQDHLYDLADGTWPRLRGLEVQRPAARWV